MSILSLKDTTFSRKAGPLFEHAALEIEAQDKIGLIGQNGSGKSSLLSLLIKDLVPDSGEIAWAKDFSFSYLPQEIDVPEGVTLQSFLYLGRASEISDAGGRSVTREDLGGAPQISLENRYRALCHELGFPDLDAPMMNFSGGEKKKVALARALAPYFHLLILDEPTNHLDVRTIEWLEEQLQSMNQAFILVTHDRWFLDSVVNTIVEIDRHSLRTYPGSYSKFLEEKASYLTSLEHMENKRLANLKIELEWLNRGARARATKSERRKKEIEKMRESLLEEGRPRVTFAANSARLGKKVCVMRGVGLGFGGRALFGNFSWELAAGAKVGIVGPNGSGKSSFLKLIAGQLSPSSGSIEIGQTVHMSMFEQTNNAVDGELSVLDFIQEHADHFVLPGMPGLDAEFLLERFGFSRSFQGQKLKTLSGGELRRLMLVRVLAESPNLLLLDEPTNDLDIETIESLESFCGEFSGSILMVSHDRLLVDRLADELLIFDGKGQIERFRGSYFSWKLSEEKGSDTPEEGHDTNATPLRASNRGKTHNSRQQIALDPGATKPNKLSYREKQELASLLDEIDALETEKRGLEAFFQNPSGDAEVSFAEAGRRYEELGGVIAEKTARWEELASRD